MDSWPEFSTPNNYGSLARLSSGMPFSIASYAALTEMVTSQTRLRARHLMWTRGDCHIYYTHLD